MKQRGAQVVEIGLAAGPARIRRVSPRRLKYAVDSAPIHFRYAASEINYQPLATQDIRAPRHATFPTRVTVFPRSAALLYTPLAFKSVNGLRPPMPREAY